MKVLPQQSRRSYLDTQINRSKSKFQYCKVSFRHVHGYRRILKKIGAARPEQILCLGTRNGREVDIFRQVFLGRGISHLSRVFEVKKYGWSSTFPWLERQGRSELDKFSPRMSLGVEINPEGERSDVLVGSFDELPPEWSQRFDIVYSNSLDQSMDPKKSAREWIRVLKPGGLMIVGFDGREPTVSDPTGFLTIMDILDLFPGDLKFYQENHSNYNDAVISFT